MKGNKYARLAPKDGVSVRRYTYLIKKRVIVRVVGVGFGSCARKNMQLCADQIRKATIKTEAQRQAALIYTVA